MLLCLVFNELVHQGSFVGLFREPSSRNMRPMLASVILRLLGSRVVHEDVDLSFNFKQLKREAELVSSIASSEIYRESLFDRLLLVLHGLLSSCQPSWLRSKTANDFSGFDREALESFQV